MDTDDAYTAGLLDGDGSIGLYLRSTYIQVQVHITLQDLETLEWVQSLYGGTIQKMPTINAWRPSDRVGFLCKILPYLRIKKAQAELVLEYRSISGYNRPALEEKIAYAQRSKMLNARFKNIRNDPSTESKGGE